MYPENGKKETDIKTYAAGNMMVQHLTEKNCCTFLCEENPWCCTDNGVTNACHFVCHDNSLPSRSTSGPQHT